MNTNYILNTLCYVTEVITFITSVFLFLYNRKRVFLFLLLLMTSIVFFETVLKFQWFKFFNISSCELIFSNILLLTEVCFYQIILYQLIENKKIKKVILIIISILLLLPFTILKNREPFYELYITTTYSVGAIATMGIIIFYFIEKIDNIVQDGFLDNFWNIILAFLFIFLAVEISYMSLINYIALNKMNIKNFYIPMRIKYIFSIVYYLSYIPAALWLKKK